MNINYLKEFCALAESSNFQKAAENLFLSQPSLTRHIKLLEENLGVSVFDRTTRKVELNDYGQILLPYAKEIVRLHEELMGAISSTQNELSNLITIGSPPFMIQYSITDLMTFFKSKYPFYLVNIVEETSLLLIQFLHERKCDFAFIRTRKNETGKLTDKLETITLATDTIVAVLPSGHPLNKEKNLTVSHFKNERLLLPKSNSLKTMLMDAFDQAGFHPNIAYVGSRIDAIADMVRNGMGVAFVLKSYMRSVSCDTISIRELDYDFAVDISLAYVKSRKMNIPCSNFLDLAKTWIKNH